MCGAPWGTNTGHVFNQRQQNAFIKPITGKSCGAEPHSHFHYSSSRDSHLQLTWCLSSHLLPIRLLLWFVYLLYSKFVNHQLHDGSLFKHFVNLLCILLLSGAHSSFYHNGIDRKRPLWFVSSDLVNLHVSSNGWKNSATLELIKTVQVLNKVKQCNVFHCVFLSFDMTAELWLISNYLCYNMPYAAFKIAAHLCLWLNVLLYVWHNAEQSAKQFSLTSNHFMYVADAETHNFNVNKMELLLYGQLYTGNNLKNYKDHAENFLLVCITFIDFV